MNWKDIVRGLSPMERPIEDSAKLRDQFSIAVFDSIFNRLCQHYNGPTDTTLPIIIQQASVLSYQIADAMLEARKPKPKET